MTAPTYTHVDLLRHGEVVGGPRFRGSSDDPLSAHGWREMGGALRGAGPWDRVVASPLQRCRDFARHLAHHRGIPLEEEPRLREMHFGDWENRTAAELMRESQEALTRFWQDPIHNTPPGGESLPLLQGRVLAAWRQLLRRHAGQRLLVITHGGPIRVILAHLRGWELGRVLELEVKTAERIPLEARINPDGSITTLLLDRAA